MGGPWSSSPMRSASLGKRPTKCSSSNKGSSLNVEPPASCSPPRRKSGRAASSIGSCARWAEPPRYRRPMSRALQELLGIEEPIVLGPFGGLSSVELTALVSEAGGLGSFGLYGYSPQRIHETIDQLRAATDRPFAVNVWLPTGDEATPSEVDLAPFIA